MPLEHRWDDLQTPLGSVTPRERKALKIVAGVVAVAALVTLIALVVVEPARRDANCIDIVGASTMGSSNYRACGTAAQNFCAGLRDKTDQQGVQMYASCRKSGFE